jgi:hypothetical protein
MPGAHVHFLQVRSPEPDAFPDGSYAPCMMLFGGSQRT